MNRSLVIAALFAALSATTVQAGDSVRLLTGQDPGQDAAAVLDQAMPPAQPVVAPVKVVAEQKVVATTKPMPSKVELAALYYYADQKQTERVEAEFRRLQLKYPGFELPKDLYLPEAARGAVDEKLLWSLYAANDIAGVEAEIARRNAEIPEWRPSEDFTAKFARKKVRVTIENSARAKDWPGLIAAASALDPATETEVDLLWDLIDAYSATGDTRNMAGVYRALLFRDAAHPLPKPAIITTIQKATRDFPVEDIRALVARFGSDPVIAAGIGNVSVDLLRRQVAEFNADKARSEPLPKTDVDALEKVAAKDGKVGDFSLLGWYLIKIKEPAEAGAWFRRALDKEANVEHAKGLYLSLVQQDRQQEAYDLALKYRDALAADPVFLMNALAERFSKPETGAIDAEAVKAYSTAILGAKSGDHAEILAWYAYNSGQYEAARAWFGKAFGWAPNEARLKGLALSGAQLNDKAALVALYRQYGTAYPTIWDDIRLNKKGRRAAERRPVIDTMKVGAVEPEFLAEDPAPKPERRRPQERVEEAAPVSDDGNVSKAVATKDYRTCMKVVLAQEARGALSPAGSLAKGWCLMGLKRTAEAKAAFSAALAGSGKVQADASYGLALALLRGKLTDDAEAVANLYPMVEKRDREIRAEIYWQKARSSFDRKQYQRTLDALNARMAIVPEPTNLTSLRAWAHFNLGHVTEARAIFERLGEHLDDAAIRRGLQATKTQSQASNR